MPAHLDDIESDMSAIHRIDDMLSLPAGRFFRLVWRLPAYRGVMRERALAEQTREADAPRRPAGRERPAPPRRESADPPGTRQALRTVDGPVTEAVLTDRVMQGIFSFS